MEGESKEGAAASTGPRIKGQIKDWERREKRGNGRPARL
jgi:hypothetical protein